MIRVTWNYRDADREQTIKLVDDNALGWPLGDVVQRQDLSSVLLEFSGGSVVSIKYEVVPDPGRCGYTHSHTREFCGNERCRQH